MYIAITGVETNKDVYICRSYRKENRPNPIITMGLFMDADGIPLAFDVFPGNRNQQTTLKPLEAKVIQDFECSKFIFCSDACLGSKENCRYNSFGNRAYVITQSLERIEEEDRYDGFYAANKYI